MPDFRLDIGQLDVLTLDGAPNTPSPPSDDFWYNNYGLQNANIVTRKVVVNAPNLALASRGFPRADGMYAETALYQQNTIKLEGVIKATSRVNLEATMDAMKKALGVTASQLKIIWQGSARYYDNCYATTFDTIFDQRDFYHITFVPFSIAFVCLNPYGRDANRWLVDAPYAITASPTNYIVTNNGTAYTDPIVTITCSTAGTLSQIVFLNNATGDTMTLAATFNNGDSINIDGEAKQVTINGVPADYTGVIPRIKPGDNNLQLNLTGSGYSLAFTEQHYPRWY